MPFTLVVPSYSLTLYRLTQVVFYAVVAAAQLSTTASTTSTTSTSVTTTTSTTTSTSDTTTTTGSTSSSAAWTLTETGPPSYYQTLLDPAATPLPGHPDWCPTYHGASWTPMAPSRSGDLESFRADGSVLSFTIFCGVNIPEDPALNPYVFDVETHGAASFDDCLQSCAEYSTRHAQSPPNFGFGKLCSGVTWDKQGTCWLKTGVSAVMTPMHGPNGAMSAILQWPPKTVFGLESGTMINNFTDPHVAGNNQNNVYNITLEYKLCSGDVGTIFC